MFISLPGINHKAKAFSAPINDNALELDGEQKSFFKVGGYRDGVQKAIFDETQKNISPDFGRYFFYNKKIY